MEQLTLTIQEEQPALYIPEEQELQELWFEIVAGRWTDKGKNIYWHPKEGHDYWPCWTLGNWGNDIFPKSKEHLKQILAAFIPYTTSPCHE